MTSRYVLSASPAEVGQHVGLTIPDDFPPRYNIAPSQPVGIIRASRRDITDFALVRWGFVPGWDRQGTFFAKALTAVRSETVAEKNSFRFAWRRRRCLFPMNGWYAWQETGDGRYPYLIAGGEGMPLVCAGGIWEYWLGEDGSEMETAAILTRAAPLPLGQWQSRCPVIVPARDYHRWLHADETNSAPAEAVINAPLPDLCWWRVGQRVGDWREDDAGLVEKVSY